MKKTILCVAVNLLILSINCSPSLSWTVPVATKEQDDYFDLQVKQADELMEAGARTQKRFSASRNLNWDYTVPHVVRGCHCSEQSENCR